MERKARFKKYIYIVPHRHRTLTYCSIGLKSSHTLLQQVCDVTLCSLGSDQGDESHISLTCDFFKDIPTLKRHSTTQVRQ